jgi:ethanolamine utilization microcompartment shell protein EutL
MQRIELGDKEAAIRQKIAEAVAMYGEENRDAIEDAVRAVAQAEEQMAQVQKLKDLYRSIGQTVEDGLVNAIQGAIDGTKTLGDVARSVFREIQTSLIRFGVNAFLGALFPSSSFFRANGGTVSRGKSYIVEQRGKELGAALSVAIQSELLKQKRPGGLLA